MSNSFSEQFDVLPQYPALIYGPSRNRGQSRGRSRSRTRFAENVVQKVSSEEQAIAGVSPEKKLHAAVVAGPVKSSEGFMVYYLVRWLA